MIVEWALNGTSVCVAPEHKPEMDITLYSLDILNTEINISTNIISELNIDFELSGNITNNITCSGDLT